MSHSHIASARQWMKPLASHIILATAFVLPGCGSLIEPITIASPLISPASGSYLSGQSLTLSSPNQSASIHYTTDGTTPSVDSPLYTAPLTVTKSLKLNAVAVAGSATSLVSSASFAVVTGHLVFDTQPDHAISGVPLTPVVAIHVVDDNGILVNSFDKEVALSFSGGSSAASLTGISTATAVHGVATFAGLGVTAEPGTYSLLASSPGLVSATSIPFLVTATGVTLHLSASSVGVGSVNSGSIELTQPAGPGGLVVSLSSNAPSSIALSPNRLTIAAGKASGDFTYTALSSGPSLLTASATGYVSSSAEVLAAPSLISNAYFGLTVLNTGNSVALPVGISRTWDVSPSIDWDDTNPAPGRFDFTGLEAFIKANQARGSEMVHTLGRTPRWASSQPNAPGTYAPGECAPPTKMSDWDEYVRAFATHAAGRIKYWEVWNEPNNPKFYCGDISTMVTMAAHAYQIIKSIDSSAVILSPAVTGYTGPAWLDSFLSQGGSNYVDVIAMHGYWLGTAETLPSIAAQYRALMAAHHLSNLPLWDTEASWAGGSASLSLQQQAAFLSKYYLLHWSLGMPRFIWYAYDAKPEWGQLWNSSAGLNSVGTSYLETYRWMMGASLTTACAVDQASVWTCGFSRAGYQAEALWNSASAGNVVVPSQFTEYRDLEGGIHPIVHHTVSVGNSPILIETSSSPDASVIPPPTFSVVPGTYAGTQSVVLSSPFQSATFFYTLDGTFPNSSSTQYTGAITMSRSGLIRAVAIVHGISSLPALGAYDITPTVATHLGFISQPSGTTPGVSLGTIYVAALDATNHPVKGSTTVYPVTLSVGSNPGGGVLSGTLTAPTSGITSAAFSKLAISQPGVGYTLIASSPGLASATSAAFTISAPTITAKLTSSTINVGGALTGTFVLGMPAGSSGLDVAISSSAPSILGVSPASVHIAAGASSGTFTYTGLKAGTSTLSLSAPLYTGTSVAISVMAVANHLSFVSQPVGSMPGSSLGNIYVAALDTTNHQVSGSATVYPVTVSIGANPGAAKLSGTLSASTVGLSSAVFSNLSLSQSGLGYTLIASSPGLASASSAPFNINPPTITTTLTSAAMNVGATSTATVALGAPAGTGGVDVAVTSSASSIVSVTPGSIHIAAAASRGTFTLTGLAAGSSTLSVSAPSYTGASALVSISSAALIPPSLFGLEVLNFSGLTTTLPFGTTRSWDEYPSLDWADINPSDGTFLFSSLDTFMLQNAAQNADMIYTFGRTPQWASSLPSQTGMYGPGQCAPPADLQKWDAFVTAIVTHAAGRIKYWELWNEPNDPSFYCGDVPTMVTMAQHAYQIIKYLDPTATIIAPGVTGTTGPAWLSSFLTQGGAATSDIVAFHGYATNAAEDLVPLIGNYRAVMLSAGVSAKPLWDTEGSWGGGGALASVSSQAGYVAKSYLLQWSSGVPRAVWYAYDGSSKWGGLYTPAAGPTIAATAYSETSKWLVGAAMTYPCSAGTNSVWTCGLSRPGYTAEAVWIPNSTTTFNVPANFVQYRDLQGVVHTLNSPTVTITDQPILLESGNLP